MRTCTISPSFRKLVTLSVACLSFPLAACAQNAFAAGGATSADFASDPAPASVNTSSWHETAIPADKRISAKVTDGVLTVDGLVAKVQLNYTIDKAGYLYFFVPGIGTAIVSRAEMYGASKVKGGLHGSTLAFSTGGHSFELSSDTPLAEGKNCKADVYVRLDTNAASLDRYAMVGFGDTTRAPYNWPLSARPEKDNFAHFVTPPPIPAGLLPRRTPATTTQAASKN